MTGERSGDRLAKDEEGWYFDTQAGIEEILDRRIGLNELHAIATAAIEGKERVAAHQMEAAAESSEVRAKEADQKGHTN